MVWVILIIAVLVVIFIAANSNKENSKPVTSYTAIEEQKNQQEDWERSDRKFSDSNYERMVFDKSITNQPFFLIFDCETTGKPGDGKINRIVQLAWIVLDSDFKLVKEKSYYLNPGKPIPPKTTAIHQITDEMVRTQSTPHFDVLTEFHTDVKQCSFLVAHNYEFDAGRVDLETRKAKIDAEELKYNPKAICTMLSSVKFCKLTPKRYGEYKWPKLEELAWECSYFIRVRHDALSDVLVTARCFEYLVNNNIIRIKSKIKSKLNEINKTNKLSENQLPVK